MASIRPQRSCAKKQLLFDDSDDSEHEFGFKKVWDMFYHPSFSKPTDACEYVVSQMSLICLKLSLLTLLYIIFLVYPQCHSVQFWHNIDESGYT